MAALSWQILTAGCTEAQRRQLVVCCSARHWAGKVSSPHHLRMQPVFSYDLASC
jgi:hypothetical protein